MRKLVTIRKITEILPIEDADAIERIILDGWTVVAKKGLHEVGDYVFYAEIDSVLPVREEFEFLRKTSFIDTKDYTGFRLKTIRLRGTISSGVIFKIEDFFEIEEIDGEKYINTLRTKTVSLNNASNIQNNKQYKQ